LTNTINDSSKFTSQHRLAAQVIGITLSDFAIKIITHVKQSWVEITFRCAAQIAFYAAKHRAVVFIPEEEMFCLLAAS
jgi:hypothetical protein